MVYSVMTEMRSVRATLVSILPLLSESHSVLTQVREMRPKLISSSGNLYSLSPRMMPKRSVVEPRTRRASLDRPRRLKVAGIVKPVLKALWCTIF